MSQYNLARLFYTETGITVPTKNRLNYQSTLKQVRSKHEMGFFRQKIELMCNLASLLDPIRLI